MSTHNIEFYNEIRKRNICFLEQSEEFRRDSKRVRISYGKRANSVRVIEVRLYAEIRILWNYKKSVVENSRIVKHIREDDQEVQRSLNTTLPVRRRDHYENTPIQMY